MVRVRVRVRVSVRREGEGEGESSHITQTGEICVLAIIDVRDVVSVQLARCALHLFLSHLEHSRSRRRPGHQILNTTVLALLIGA